MCAPDAHPSARGTPSAQAPSEIGANVHSEGNPFVLPRTMVDAPRAHNQVPRQSDQRRPVCGGGVCHPPAELL
eukprot:7583436-Alexandrium_andersonii.AAC.1